MSVSSRPVQLIVLLGVACAVTGGLAPRPQSKNLGFSFTNVAKQAGLDAVTVFGGKDTNKYLLETTGTGAAAIDYDGDGWLDIFLVNGTVLEGFPKGREPTNHLYRNRGNGTFEDVTDRAGLRASGWGQAPASATTTMTDTTISSSRIGVRTACTETEGTARSRTSRAAPV